MMAYKIVQTILKILFKPLFRIEVIGKENIPIENGYIICANHKSNWDPVFLAIAFEEPISFMGKKELFDIPVFGNIAKGLRAFPVDRDNRDLKSLKETIKRLKVGENIGIMPEGTRTKNISRDNMKEGVSFIALKANKDIVPVEIISKFRPFSKSYVYIKEPIKISKYKNIKNKEAMVKITDQIYQGIYEIQLEQLESSNNGY